VIYTPSLRFFSSTPSSNDTKPSDDDDEDSGVDFPYAFLNRDELIKPADDVDEALRDAMTKFLELRQTKEAHGDDCPRLKDIFAV